MKDKNSISASLLVCRTADEVVDILLTCGLLRVLVRGTNWQPSPLPNATTTILLYLKVVLAKIPTI